MWRPPIQVSKVSASSEEEYDDDLDDALFARHFLRLMVSCEGEKSTCWNTIEVIFCRARLNPTDKVEANTDEVA